MKLKNILSMVCFLCLAVSCSMDDETVMNDMQNQIEKENVSEGNAYLSFNVSPTTLQTRSAVNGEPESTWGQGIYSCSMILYSGDDILFVQDSLQMMPTKTESMPSPPYPEGTIVDKIAQDANRIRVLTKKRDGLSVMVVANTTLSLSDRTAYPNMTAINKAVENLSETMIDGSNLLKVGTADVTFDDKVTNPNFEASTGTGVIDDGETTNVYVQKVTVTQRAAAIRLRKFDVNFVGGTEAPVYITKIELLNSNHKVYLDGSQYEATDAYKTLSYVLPKDNESQDDNRFMVYGPNKNTGNYERKTFLPITQFSFPNFRSDNTNEDQRVRMKIYYTVGGFSYTSEFVINRPEGNSTGTTYVHSNYIYYLDVTANITNHNVSCDVVCYTQDWMPNEISGTLTR